MLCSLLLVVDASRLVGKSKNVPKKRSSHCGCIDYRKIQILNRAVTIYANSRAAIRADEGWGWLADRPQLGGIDLHLPIDQNDLLQLLQKRPLRESLLDIGRPELQREGCAGDERWPLQADDLLSEVGLNVQGHRRRLQRLDGPHVDRHRPVDDLIEEVLGQGDSGLPQARLLRVL